MRLPDVCSIQIGYTARARFEPAADGGVLAIQWRDLSGYGELNPDQMIRVQLNERVDRYLVEAGDVLFRSRGDRNTATALEEHFGEPAIAVSPLMILRPNPAAVMGKYLAWLINQPDAQRHFDLAARGTSIRMVPKASLDDLQIDVPDLETQGRIVAIDALAQREEVLMHQLASKKRQLTNLVLAERAKCARPATNPKRNGK